MDTGCCRERIERLLVLVEHVPYRVLQCLASDNYSYFIAARVLFPVLTEGGLFVC